MGRVIELGEEEAHGPGRAAGDRGGGGPDLPGGGPDLPGTAEGGAGTGPLNLPTRLAADPIRAVKRAGLMYSQDRLVFRPLAHSDPYTADAVAVCARKLPHRAPCLECTCGFYGSRAAMHLLSATLYPTVKLDVEFLGRVIVHKRGYRAERQRVLSVMLPPGCRFPRCPHPIASIVLVPFESLFHLRILGLRSALPYDGLAVESYCKLHLGNRAKDTGSPLPPLTPAEMSGLLGTEVHWR